MSSIAFAERNPANNRSVISNEPRRLSASVDMRSPDGRLFADCYDILAVEFPDADPLKLREVAVLISWEFPRLCRGGSSSLTFPTVAVERG
jgi:hypothetical protein